MKNSTQIPIGFLFCHITIVYILVPLSLFSRCLAYICWLGWQHRSPNSLYIPCKINDGNSQFLLGLSLNPPRIFQTSSTSLGGARFMTSMTKNTARPLTTTFAHRPVVSWKIVSFMDILLTSFLSRLQFARGSLNAVTTCSALSGVKVVRVYTIKRNCVLLIEERERERESNRHLGSSRKVATIWGGWKHYLLVTRPNGVGARFDRESVTRRATSRPWDNLYGPNWPWKSTTAAALAPTRAQRVI